MNSWDPLTEILKSVGLEWGLRICISNEVPCDADAVCQQTIV